MALYSVWDWNRNAYRIYTTRSPVSVGDDPIPPRPSGAHTLGADPDTHVKALPRGVRLVGYSHLPRGEVRRRSKWLADVGDDAGSNDASYGGKLAMLGVGIVIGAGVMWWVGREP